MDKAKFGYTNIDSKEKPIKVNEVFTSVSNKQVVEIDSYLAECLSWTLALC